jgi:hypothetical protein
MDCERIVSIPYPATTLPKFVNMFALREVPGQLTVIEVTPVRSFIGIEKRS